MNPDRLFDYLDGKLSPSERAELEEQLVSDPDVQRELNVARQIHRSMRDSREILGSLEENSTTNRGAVLGRRIAVAFAVLVFANVLFGIYAIFFMEKKRQSGSSRDRNRQELQQALLKSAAATLPTPSLDVDDEEDDENKDPRKWLKVIDAYEMPRLVYNVAKNHFDRSATSSLPI